MYPFGVAPLRELWRGLLGPNSRVLVLAALCLVPLAALGGTRAPTIWALTLMVLAAGFALGPWTPLFTFYTLLPMLGWFRVPHRVLIVGQFALATLGGVGLDVARRHPRVRSLVPLAVFVLVGVAISEGIRRPAPVPPLPYRSGVTSYLPALHDEYSRLAASAGHFRAWPFNPLYTHYGLPPKLPTLTGLRSIDDYEPMLMRRPWEYFAFLATGRVSSGGRPPSNVVQSLAGIPGAPPPAARRRPWISRACVTCCCRCRRSGGPRSQRSSATPG
jgi:hypothetical protein